MPIWRERVASAGVVMGARSVLVGLARIGSPACCVRGARPMEVRQLGIMEATPSPA